MRFCCSPGCFDLTTGVAFDHNGIPGVVCVALLTLFSPSLTCVKYCSPNTSCYFLPRFQCPFPIPLVRVSYFLGSNRLKAWAAAAARRRRLGMLSVSFSAWAGTRRRVAAIHSLTKWAAARRRRLALAGGFRALCLSGRRATITATATATAVGENIGGGRGDGDGGRDGRVLVVEASVQEAFAAKAAMEGKVGQLRARLAQQKARALERHATASEVAEEVARSERERARYAKILRRQVEQPLAPTSKTTTSAEEDTTGVGPGSLEEQLFPWGDGSTRKHGEEGEKGEGWRGILEPSRSPGGRMGLSELAEKEGELFGKLQAETLELRQVAAAAKKQEEQLRAEAARKSAVTTAALESALAEGNRLKEEAEQHKVTVCGCYSLSCYWAVSPPSLR